MSSEQSAKYLENPALPINVKRAGEAFGDTNNLPNRYTNSDRNNDLPIDDITGQYLKEIASYKPLTEEEEKKLSIQLDKGRYFENDERTLKNMRLTESGREAYNNLVNHNLRLVVSIAKRYRGQGVEFDDLISKGNEGLMTGIAKYEPERGFKLSTYATWWIRQSIGREVACNARAIRLPVYYHDQLHRMSITINNLTQTLKREPTREEIAESLCVTTYDVNNMFSDLQTPISLETPVNDKDINSDAISDFVDSSQTDIGDDIDKKEIQEQVRQTWLNMPNARDKMIIGLRNGLLDGNTYTLEETAQFFGLTRERIRQLECRAKTKLRKSLRKHQKYISIFD